MTPTETKSPVASITADVFIRALRQACAELHFSQEEQEILIGYAGATWKQVFGTQPVAIEQCKTDATA